MLIWIWPRHKIISLGCHSEKLEQFDSLNKLTAWSSAIMKMMFGIDVRATILNDKCSPAPESTSNCQRMRTPCQVLEKSLALDIG